MATPNVLLGYAEGLDDRVRSGLALAGRSRNVCYLWEEMARKIPYNPMFEPGGRLRCEDCDAHDSSPEGYATSKLFSLVYELAGYGRTPEHPYGRHADIPDELHLRRAYYAAYHEQGHFSCSELDLEETPTDP